MIGHEITALTGLTHGHTLVIVLPGVMDVMRQTKGSKIIQFGERVWNITEGSNSERIDATIAATENFFRSLGLKTRLSEMGNDINLINEIVLRFKERGTKLGENGDIDYLTTEKILNSRL